MQRIKQQVDQLQQQLAGLTRAQKAFALLLVGVMLVSALLWALQATNDNLVPLFDEPARAGDVSRLQSALAARGIDAQVDRGQLYVSEAARADAIAALAWESLLPDDSNSALGEAIDKIGSFDARQKIEARLLQATRDELKRTIEAFPGVASASVHVNPVYKKQIGQSLLPSASVSIATNGAADVRKLAQAVSCLLANSISALTPERVTVVVDGRLISASGDAELRSTRELQARSEAESYFAQKIRESLGNIPGLIVSVAVNTRYEGQSASTSVTPAAESAPNVAVERTAASRDVSFDRPLSLSDIVNVLSTSGSVATTPVSGAAERTRDAAGPLNVHTPASCSIVLPMTWIVHQWQARNRMDEIPSADALREFEAAKLEELRRVASASLGGLSQQEVSIIVDADGALLASSEDVPALSDTEDSAAISAMISNYGREVAIAALAAVSVLLISSMVKKGASVGAAVYQTQSLACSVEDFTQFGSLGGLPDDVMASGQVVEQIQSLVRHDPDAAAALVRGWLAA